MATKRIQRIRVPVAGVDTENSPDYVPEMYATRLNNLLPRGGRVVMRGGWEFLDTNSGSGGPNTNYALNGLMVFDGQFLANIQGAGQEHVDLTSGPTGTPLGSSPAIHSRRYARVGAYVYGPGTPTPGNGLALNRWAGGVTLPTALSTSVAPSGACDVIEHAERVFVMGASLGTAGGPSSIIWSDPGGTSAVPAITDWQDNVSGLTNQLIVGAVDNDQLVAFGKIGRSLVIFKKRSIYMLDGSGPSSFVLRRFSDQLGCVSRDSVCSFDEGTYFLSDRGLLWFDGAQIREASKPVRAEIQYAIKRTLLSPFPYMTVGDIGNGCLYIAMGTFTATPGTAILSNTTPFVQYIYDTVRDAWSQMSIGTTSLQSQPVKPHAVFWANGKAVLHDGNQYGYADRLVTPDYPLTNAGVDKYWTTSTFTTTSIPAAYSSRLLPLASPDARSQLQRLMLDYTFSGSGTPLANGWHVALQDGAGVPLLSADLPPGASGGGVRRQRAVFDVFSETDDAQLVITWPNQGSTPPTVVQAEIFDCALEYRPAQERH